ncbi:MAG: porin [Planctomycetia bacterium]|nr:porin [Planctomycetia bacterium]
MKYVSTAILGIAMLRFLCGFVYAEETMISVPEKEWEQVRADLAAIQESLKTEKEKADAKKKAEEEKKRTSPKTTWSGRFYFDGAASHLNDDGEAILGDETNGTRFRTARLGVKGSLYDMIEYELEVDFTGSSLGAKNVFAGLKNLPCGVDVRLGHFKEPWSLENLSSSTRSVMIERSVLNGTKDICGGRNNGLMLHNWHTADRWTWAVGGFAASMPEAFTSVDMRHHLAATARVTFLPFYTECPNGSRYLWHLGASYSTRCYNRENAAAYKTSFRTGADSAIAQSMMDSGVLDGLDSLNAFLVESTWIRGPLSVDFEQAFFWMDDVYAGDATVQSGYAQVSYFLTGESRNYQKKGGYFGLVEPNNPFVRTCKEGVGFFSGPGAWEIAYRCAWIDSGELVCTHYDTASVQMGKTVNHVWGVNWYWNKNCRWMFNYVLANTDYEGRYAGKHGREQVWEARVQVVF